MRRKRGGRRTEHAEAGAENDERRPVVPSFTCVRKRFLEGPQDSAIGAGVPAYPGAFAWVGDSLWQALEIAGRAFLLVGHCRKRVGYRVVEEIELTGQIDLGPRSPSSCRHARRLAWRGRQ